MGTGRSKWSECVCCNVVCVQTLHERVSPRHAETRPACMSLHRRHPVSDAPGVQLNATERLVVKVKTLQLHGQDVRQTLKAQTLEGVHLFVALLAVVLIVLLPL